MKKSALAYAIMLGLGAPAVFASDIVTVNPDAGGTDPSFDVGSLDWTAGSAISIGVGGQGILGACNPDNTGACQNATPFQTYAHATLSAFVDENGVPVGGLQLNGPTAATNYEWTYVAGFQEVVTSLTGTGDDSNANFEIVAGGDNFFRIYYDAAKNANPLSGLGFADGTLILEGIILPYDPITGVGESSFASNPFAVDTAGNPIIPDLDQFSGNSYPGIGSVTGSGGTTAAIQVVSYNHSFFTGLPTIILLDFDTQQNLAFDQTNPSGCFTKGDGTLYGGAGYTNGATTCANNVGSVNGVSGPDVMFQTDATTNFNTEVPEPASLALLGAGLLGLGIARRRKS